MNRKRCFKHGGTLWGRKKGFCSRQSSAALSFLNAEVVFNPVLEKGRCVADDATVTNAEGHAADTPLACISFFGAGFPLRVEMAIN